MFKNFNLSSILPTIIIGLFVGVIFVYADWSAPLSSPPTCAVGDPGCAAPINVSNYTQFKSGNLGIGGIVRGFSNLVITGNATNPIGGSCPNGYDWYDDGDGTIDNEECLRTSLYTSMDGNVGIGTTAPKVELDVNGAIKIGSGAVGNCDSNYAGKIRFDSTTNKLVLCNGSQWKAFILESSLPTVNLTTSDSDNRIPVGYTITLNWSSNDAISCSASGAWSGAKSTSGSENVTPPSDSSYILTCTNSSGSTNDTEVVQVVQWQNTTGEGNFNESCNAWLSRTGQAGIDGSRPRLSGPGAILDNYCLSIYNVVGICPWPIRSTQSESNIKPIASGAPYEDCNGDPLTNTYIKFNTQTRR